MVHVGGGGQPLVHEGLVGVPVLRHDLQQEIRLAGQHVALAHLGPAIDGILEDAQIGLGLAGQADQREHRQLVAQQLGRDIGVVAADEARLLQRAHAAQAGRCRDAGAARQIHIGHPALLLQIVEDAPVDTVEFHAPGRHKASLKSDGV